MGFSFGASDVSAGKPTGLPGLLNVAIGDGGSVLATVDGWEDGTLRSCSHPTLQHVPFMMMGDRALCTGTVGKSDLPPGTSVRLLGKTSALGISVERIEWKRR